MAKAGLGHFALISYVLFVKPPLQTWNKYIAPDPEWAKLEEFGSNWKLIEGKAPFLLQIARCPPLALSLILHHRASGHKMPDSCT